MLTLKAPELQHYSAALQVVQQTLGGVEGCEVNSVIQQRVDVVPHGRSVERLAAVKQPETERVGEEDIRTKYLTSGRMNPEDRNIPHQARQDHATFYLSLQILPLLLYMWPHMPHPIWTPLLRASLIQRRPQHCSRTSWKSSRRPSNSDGSIRMSSSPRGLEGQKKIIY